MGFTAKDWGRFPWPGLGRGSALAGDAEAFLEDVEARLAEHIERNRPAGENVVEHGADPKGVVSSTVAFQAALDAGDIVIPSGTYRVGRVIYEGAQSRAIRALGPVTLIQTNAQGLFDLRGGWDSFGVVSSIDYDAQADLVDAGESSTDSWVSTLALASAGSVAKGDVLKLVSDDVHPMVPTGSGSRMRLGEYVLAGLSSTGTTVTLTKRPIESTYATNIRLLRLWDTSFRVTGPITFDTDPDIRDTTIWGAALLLRAARECYVGDGVSFHNSLGRAIGNLTYGSSFVGIQFRNLANRPSKSQYGYGIMDGGHGTKVVGCHGQHVRHLYSETGEAIGAGWTTYEYYGGGAHAVVSGCTAFGCQSQAFDTHPTAYGVSFVGCKVDGSFIGASSGGGGIVLRGRECSAIGCTVDNCQSGITVSGIGHRVINCRVRRARFIALEVRPDTAGTHITTWPDNEIAGGEYDSTASATVAAIGAASNTVSAKLDDVTLRSREPGAGAKLISLLGTARLDFKRLRFDLEQVAGAVALRGIVTSDDAQVVRGDGLEIRGAAAPYTSFTLLDFDTAGQGASVQVRGIDYEHDTVALTPHNSLTAVRLAYRAAVGATETASRAIEMTAASGAVVPLADRLDERIVVYLTGANGVLTLGALPAGGLQGQQVHFRNDSNGTVTVGTISGGNVNITTGGSIIAYWLSGVWKRFY